MRGVKRDTVSTDCYEVSAEMRWVPNTGKEVRDLEKIKFRENNNERIQSGLSNVMTEGDGTPSISDVQTWQDSQRKTHRCVTEHLSLPRYVSADFHNTFAQLTPWFRMTSLT